MIGVDTVFHLAPLPGEHPSWGPEFDAYIAANIQTVQRIMAAATRLRVRRVVLASSSSAYGATEGSPNKETARTGPHGY